MAESQRDLARTLLAVLFIGALIFAAFWILRPFIVAGVWALMIVVVTWPLMLRVQKRLWGSRWLAIAVMIVLLLLVFVVPLTLAIGAIVLNADEIVLQVAELARYRVPLAPNWIADLPFVGQRIARAWAEAATLGVEGLWARLLPYAGNMTAWFVARAGNLGYLAIQFGLTLLLAAFMFAHGEIAGAAALRFGHKLGGRRGEDLVRLAAQATRGVAFGVGLTAVIQSVLGGIGLFVAGVPFAGVLTSVLFMLCLSQIGMLPVLVPAVIWVYATGHPAWGTFLLIWSLIASLVDNVIRPVLVRRNADLPLLLIFAGVIGGLIGLGLVGIFVGPVVLAVAYTLLVAWIDDKPTPTELINTPP